MQKKVPVLEEQILAVRGQGQRATDQALPVSVVEGIVGDIATKTGGCGGQGSLTSILSSFTYRKCNCEQVPISLYFCKRNGCSR